MVGYCLCRAFGSVGEALNLFSARLHFIWSDVNLVTIGRISISALKLLEARDGKVGSASKLLETRVTARAGSPRHRAGSYR
jgi:hypothetical protein